MNAILMTPRVPLAAVFFVALALVLFACSVRAADDGSRVFTWNTPDTGAPTNYKVYCDAAPISAPIAVVSASTFAWTSQPFAPGTHTCFVAWFSPNSGGFNSRTNAVSFTVPPAAVVVPPPVPFTLTVSLPAAP